MTENLFAHTSSAFEEFLVGLSGLVGTRRLYHVDHPRVIEAARRCEEAFDIWHEEANPSRDRVTVVRRGERLYLERVPLKEKASGLTILHEGLDASGATGFQLGTIQDAQSLERLADHIGSVLAGKPSEPPEDWAWLTVEDLDRLEGSASSGAMPVSGLGSLSIPTLDVDERLYATAVSELTRFMSSYEDKALELGEVHHVTENLVSKIVSEPNFVVPLTTVSYGDDFSYRHSVNVCLLTLAAARRITNDDDQLRRIGEAALLHDIGKSKTPQEILHKPGRLTDEELTILQNHPVDGARMLHGLSEVDPLAVAVAFGHHIRAGGSGYPKVSKNFEIGPITKLVQVCDIFEALTGKRPYKRSMTARETFRVLYNDPELRGRQQYVDLLFDAIGADPIGTMVEFEGSHGVVTGHSGDKTTTFIRLLDRIGEDDDVVEVDARSSKLRSIPA